MKDGSPCIRHCIYHVSVYASMHLSHRSLYPRVNPSIASFGVSMDHRLLSIDCYLSIHRVSGRVRGRHLHASVLHLSCKCATPLALACKCATPLAVQLSHLHAGCQAMRPLNARVLQVYGLEAWSPCGHMASCAAHG